MLNDLFLDPLPVAYATAEDVKTCSDIGSGNSLCSSEWRVDLEVPVIDDTVTDIITGRAC
jgi:hypothetical protein